MTHGRVAAARLMRSACLCSRFAAIAAGLWDEGWRVSLLARTGLQVLKKERQPCGCLPLSMTEEKLLLVSFLVVNYLDQLDLEYESGVWLDLVASTHVTVSKVRWDVQHGLGAFLH